MIRLTHLELENFRSFAEPAQIAFPASGLVQVRGNGSGTGKSSIFLGVAEALGVSGIPATTLRSWFGTGSRRVKATFSGPQEFSIERGDSTKLTVDGVPFEGSVAAMNDKLRLLMGVDDLEWVVPLTYRPQRAGSFFLNLSDVEKKEFLGRALGLSAFERAQQISEEALAAARTRLQSAVVEAAKATEFLTALSLQTEDPPPPPPGDTRELTARLEALRKRLEEVERRPLPHVDLPPQPDLPEDAMLHALEQKMQQLEASRSAALEAWKKADAEHRARVSRQQQLRSHLQRLEGESSSANRKAEETLAQLGICEENRCPTCAQTLLDEELKESLTARLKAERDVLSRIQENWEATKAQIEPLADPPPLPEEDLKLKAALRARIDARRKQLDEAHSSIIGQWRDARAAAQAVVTKASADKALEVSQIKGDIALVENEIRTAQSALEQAARHEAKRLKRQEDLANAQRRVDAAQHAMEEAQRSVAAEEDFALLVGPKGFMGAIFDETLLLISMEANAIMARLPNVAHVSLNWQTSKGKRKAISPSFRAHGVEVGDVWKKVFSGGQVAALELAIDLAVSKVIGRRIGVELGWLILDEPFEGVPAGEVEQIMAGLEEVAKDRLVLVVHHDSMAQEMFEATLRVHCHNGRSTVEWA